MSFDKEYPNRKDWRKPHYRAKSISNSCRNHGSCPYCKNGRLHTYKKYAEQAEEQINDYLKGLNK